MGSFVEKVQSFFIILSHLTLWPYDVVRSFLLRTKKVIKGEMPSKNESAKYGSFTHVIFDMDGLLLDTEGIYTLVDERIVSQHGGTFNWDIKVQLMGTTGRQMAALAVELMNLPLTVDEYLCAVRKHKEELFPTAKLLPGAEKLVRHLHKNGVPIAVASGSFTKDFNAKTTNHKELFELFSIIILGDNSELKRGKPDADQFLLTLSKFPNPPSCGKVLVFEDAPNGVLAAKAAGMGVVLVPDEELEKSMYHGPTCALKSLEEFSPQEFGLPAYDN